MDAGYGCNTNLRTGISALSLTYVAGILPHTTVWTPRHRVRCRRRNGRAAANDRSAFVATTSINRFRSRSSLSASPSAPGAGLNGGRGRPSRCHRALLVRVRAAHRDYTRSESRPEEWLLIEWPEGEKKPAKYWLSTLPKNIFFRKLVDLTKLRWRIERDYQELKQEVGLGHFEGRGWRGFHHHATLCIAAYGFLVSERERIPPSRPCCTTRFEKLAVPEGDRSGGSTAEDRTPRPQLDRNDAKKIDHRACQHPFTMPMLRHACRQRLAS